ncbi:MAG: TetR/AcrR family transcriptional regulator [Oscillospiraceae bacterium]|nr:TetR/AcrR family transcriptional regulator [Oscillospiraceae bacterium]
MGVRAEAKEKRRGEILAAGLDLFTRKGFAAAKITDIADAVGMSVGLLFHYYPSKEMLYEALIDMGTEQQKRLLEHLKSTEPTPEQTLLFFSTITRRILAEISAGFFPAQLYLLTAQAWYSDEPPVGLLRGVSRKTVLTVSAKQIRRGQSCGVIRDGDSHALAALFWAALEGVARTLAHAPPDGPRPAVPKAEWLLAPLSGTGQGIAGNWRRISPATGGHVCSPDRI